MQYLKEELLNDWQNNSFKFFMNNSKIDFDETYCENDHKTKSQIIEKICSGLKKGFLSIILK